MCKWSFQEIFNPKMCDFNWIVLFWKFLFVFSASCFDFGLKSLDIYLVLFSWRSVFLYHFLRYLLLVPWRSKPECFHYSFSLLYLFLNSQFIYLIFYILLRYGHRYGWLPIWCSYFQLNINYKLRFALWKAEREQITYLH